MTLDCAVIDEAIAWRRHLHRHPELAFEERATSAFIAAKLAEWGYAVDIGLGRTGVVGTLRRGSSERTLGLRADMDALPLQEATGLEYASATPGIMHACGHDGHVAMLLAAAHQAVTLPFDGIVHVIFQPAEENEGGARAMISDGLFSRHQMNSVYALHNWPALAVGRMVARDDAMMAAFGTFEITITGTGAHGAMPDEGADAVVAAAAVVTALQSIVSRNVSPLHSAVLSVTQLHGGDTWNVLPETVILRGTTRWFDEAVGERLVARLVELATAIAAGHGCRADIQHERRYPATINTPERAALVRRVAGQCGLEPVAAEPSMAAEDFAFMLGEKPGCYFWLGSQRAGDNPGLHSPRFDFNDAIIPAGIAMWLGLISAELSP